MSDSDKKSTAARVDWRGADLRGVSMAGINLEYADLRACDLRGVNFSGSNLRYADLRGAQLQGANFMNSTLYGARLQGAEAFQADFRNADLRQANLGGAYLEGAVLPAPSSDKAEQPSREGPDAADEARKSAMVPDDQPASPVRNNGQGKGRGRGR
jgi:uncharacterized protein YjbI with pentapeptide repeats